MGVQKLSMWRRKLNQAGFENPALIKVSNPNPPDILLAAPPIAQTTLSTPDKPKTLEEVTVYSTRKRKEKQKNNLLLYIVFGIIGIFFLKKFKIIR